MKKKLYTAMIVSSMVLAVTACSTKEETQDIPPSSAGSTMDVPTETDNADQVENETAATAPETTEEALTEAALLDMSGLIGKTDEEAMVLLGGGTENYTENNTMLIGRDYDVLLFGNKAAIHTMYAENGKIDLVQAEIEGFSLSDCQEAISQETGAEMESIKGGESGQEKSKWSYQGKSVYLTQLENKCIIELLTE